MEAEESRGKFRKYLAMKLTSFLIDRIRHRNAAKRGGLEVVHVELEEAEEYPSGIMQANAALFDREWARELLRRAMQRMEETELSEAEVIDRAATYGNAAFAKRLRQALREEVGLTCRMGWVDEELKHLAAVLAAIQSDTSHEAKK